MSTWLPYPWDIWAGVGIVVYFMVVALKYIWVPLLRGMWEDKRKRDPNVGH